MKLKKIPASILAVAILFTFIIPTMNLAAATNGAEWNIQVKTEVAHKATDVKTDDAQDYVESQIRSILYSSLKSAGVPGTYAFPIADAIAKVVMALA